MKPIAHAGHFDMPIRAAPFQRLQCKSETPYIPTDSQLNGAFVSRANPGLIHNLELLSLAKLENTGNGSQEYRQVKQMQPRVSTATVALAVAFVAATLLDDVDARPMHAEIEKETIKAELDEWLKTYGTDGPKNGFIPVTESRSLDDDLENRLQRFYLTKEQIEEARELNPMAEFSTDGPFTLMTMDEFKQRPPAVEKPKTLSEKEKKTPSSEETKNKDGNDTKQSKSNDKNGDEEKKTWAPATEGPVVVPMVRRLSNAGKSQYAYNGGDYSSNGEGGFQSTSDTYVKSSQQTYQSQSTPQTYQANNAGSANTGANTNQGWNFGDVSIKDSAQVAVVSGGTGNINNGNGNNGNTWNQQWTQPTGSSNNQWTPSSNNQWTPSPNNQWTPPANNQWTPPANNQWTEPPSANNPPAPAAPQTPTTPAPTDAPLPNARYQSPPTKAPPTKAPATKAPAPAAPAKKQKVTTTESTASDTARDSDSDSVDWSKSPCVNPPGLQAAQCIANGDKKAPEYSEQQLYLRDNGICTKSSYPYTSVEGGTAAACMRTCTPVKSGITGIAHLKSGDESALLGALKKQPVVVSVISNNPAWKQYRSGVITSCNIATVDHAVLAVGYDATTIKIKNSWGTDWGEDGFVRISRSPQGMGTCAPELGSADGIAASCASPVRQSPPPCHELFLPPLRLVGAHPDVKATALTRFVDENGAIRCGQRTDDGSTALLVEDDDPLGSLHFTGETATIEKVLAPVVPSQILGIGLNYRKHAKETNMPEPKFPVLFTKGVNALQHPHDPEAACNVTEEEALTTSVATPGKKGGGQWCRAKTFDTFCPLGPVQKSNTGDMIFSVAKLISQLSQDCTLPKGTLILTGTPEGVGVARNPPLFLAPGDMVEIEMSALASW
ncbi:Cysteine peptidase [Phytophthora cactorum]|nr:Cysteine peptidase [Phytophthora cactorum]